MKPIWKVAGIDEAGRGALAGPVVAAACILPASHRIAGITDSKKLSPSQREELYQKITRQSQVVWSVGLVEQDVIDQINILQATLLAMQKAVEALQIPPDFLLVDGKQLPSTLFPAAAIVDGDLASLSIGAASIIAKVTRDRIMTEYDAMWPNFGFAKHKGYGTKEHLAAIAQLGPSPLHRITFAPICSRIRCS